MQTMCTDTSGSRDNRGIIPARIPGPELAEAVCFWDTVSIPKEQRPGGQKAGPRPGADIR